MRDSEFFGYAFYACGKTVDTELFEVLQVVNKEQFHIFYLFDNQLMGFVLIGNVQNLAKYRTWYITKQCVSRQDILDN